MGSCGTDEVNGEGGLIRRVGSFGDAVVFSFCQDKIMTTGGEGGMLTTNDKAIWEKAFVKAGIGPDKRLPAARESGETSLMFLVHPTLGVDEMRDTCRAVEKVMREAIS